MTDDFRYAELADDEFKILLNETFEPKREYLEIEGCLLPAYMKNYANKIKDFKVKDDDVFVCSFPKCGTTWAQEMVWCIANNLDYETAKKTHIMQRFPFLELSGLKNNERPPPSGIEPGMLLGPQRMPGMPVMIDSLKYAENFQGQRFIKSHLPLQLLPKELQSKQCRAKIVYVARNPHDACVSYYHHNKHLHGYTGDFDTFVKLFVNDKVHFGPFWQNVLSFWKIRHQNNLLFITYEDMKKDLSAVIQRVGTFLNQYLTPEEVTSLRDHLSFDNMKMYPSLNTRTTTKDPVTGKESSYSHLRSGKSGGFLKDMTPSQIELIDAWTKKNLDGTNYVLADINSVC